MLFSVDADGAHGMPLCAEGLSAASAAGVAAESRASSCIPIRIGRLHTLRDSEVAIPNAKPDAADDQVLHNAR